MPLLVYITGKRGSGKSTVARQWATDAGAKIIAIDEILKVAGNKFDSDEKDPWSWDFWRRIRGESQQETHLQYALEANHKVLKDHSGHVVVEGSILCKDWFCDAFDRVLIEWIPVDRPDRRYFYLNPPDDVILENIRRRGRPDELKKYKTVEDVERDRRGFDDAIEKSSKPWKDHTHTAGDDLLVRLNGLRG